jgi:hypothetical protein
MGENGKYLYQRRPSNKQKQGRFSLSVNAADIFYDPQDPEMRKGTQP